jgi:hypothetical protein
MRYNNSVRLLVLGLISVTMFASAGEAVAYPADRDARKHVQVKK